MRLLRWSRTQPTSHQEGDVPRWVQGFQNVARPAIAVIILVMCAPGEHHLAIMAGWSQWLAWGMPSCLVFYTAVAAIVATKRVKGAPGKRTAVAGAVLALGLAMSAQPVSHMFILGKWLGDPTALVWVVSCIPPLVAGHLWHLAASPSQLAALVRDVKALVPPARDTERPDVPVSLSWDTAKRWGPQRDSVPDAPVHLTDEEFHAQVQRDSVPVQRDVPAAVPPRTQVSMRWSPEPDVRDSVPAPVRNVRDGSAGGAASQFLRDNPDASREDMEKHVRDMCPGASAETVRKAIYRARRAA